MKKTVSRPADIILIQKMKMFPHSRERETAGQRKRDSRTKKDVKMLTC